MRPGGGREGATQEGGAELPPRENPTTHDTQSGTCEPTSARPRGATTPCLVAEVVPSNSGAKYLLEKPDSLKDTKEM